MLVTQIMKSSGDTDENLYKSLIIDDLGVNQGMILENMVAQMLKASRRELYLHEYLYTPEESKKEKKYEIDFITVKKKDYGKVSLIASIAFLLGAIAWLFQAINTMEIIYVVLAVFNAILSGVNVFFYEKTERKMRNFFLKSTRKFEFYGEKSYGQSYDFAYEYFYMAPSISQKAKSVDFG